MVQTNTFLCTARLQPPFPHPEHRPDPRPESPPDHAQERAPCAEEP
ncbi:hypothetical protein F750_4609 [Streptomyces sp. PAMC 26508]|nr:hypothetical protein F750_4609 [Streptomyces sp. PAMC 26508]